MVLGRNCDGCTMCCKLMRVEDKPSGTWCTHCTIGGGCQIYEARPEECRSFHCGYLRMPQLTEDWRPSKCRMVVAIGPGDKRIVVMVDPDRRGAWKKEPYYSTIKSWARALCPKAGQVLVHDGPEVIGVLPDRDLPLGAHREGRQLVSVVERTPSGLKFDIEVRETSAAA